MHQQNSVLVYITKGKGRESCVQSTLLCYGTLPSAALVYDFFPGPAGGITTDAQKGIKCSAVSNFCVCGLIVNKLLTSQASKCI